ncbi:class IIb bacteriocin, lactobin A/cerein 7B family [Flammeovirga sp. OC4]|nr:class IIb bacteriocin, lactobin A/cerein 7B family [Flammeovirga sp. OC4]
MKELELNELQEIDGGILIWVAGFVVGSFVGYAGMALLDYVVS